MDYWGGQRVCWPPSKIIGGAWPPWPPLFLRLCYGFVVGPLLFLLYINEIVKDIDKELRTFADEWVCHREIKKTVKTW